MSIMNTKYAAFFLFAHQLHLYLPDLPLSWAFLLPSPITLFYCTYYRGILSGMYYNNKKANKYKLYGMLLMSFVLCFYCFLFLIYFIDNAQTRMDY